MLPLLFFLPSAPQTPDGAEIISTALYGGVAHPPGFPLQAWINRFVIYLFPVFPIKALAILSLAYTVLTLFTFSQTLLLLKIRKLYVYFLIPLYLYYPVVFGQAVQVEKYSILLLLMNLIIFQALKCLTSDEKKIKKRIFLLSIITGFLFSQHYTSIIFLPYYAFILIFIFKKKSFKTSRWSLVQSVLISLGVPIFFYLSLPFLRTEAVWPDWGNIVGVKGVIKYFFAFDHGDHRVLNNTLDLKTSLGITIPNVINPINIFIDDILRYFHITLFFALFGFVQLLKKEKTFFLVHLYSLLLAVILFSLFNPVTSLSSLGYMERHTVIIVTYFFIFYSYGINELALIKKWPLKRFLALVLLLTLSFNLFFNFNRFSAYNNNIFNIYRNFIARYIPDSAIFITLDDFIGFSGIPTSNAKVRYPINHLFNYKWYSQHVALSLEPRLATALSELEKQNSWNLYQLIQKLYDQGFLILTTTPEIFKETKATIEQRGLVWGISKNTKSQFTFFSIKAGLELCEMLNFQDSKVPLEGHYFTMTILQKFPAVFYAMSSYLYKTGHIEAGNETYKLARMFIPEIEPIEYQKQCKKISHIISGLNFSN